MGDAGRELRALLQLLIHATNRDVSSSGNLAGGGGGGDGDDGLYGEAGNGGGGGGAAGQHGSIDVAQVRGWQGRGAGTGPGYPP